MTRTLIEPSEPPTSAESGPDLVQILRPVWQRRWLVAGVTLAMGLVLFVVTSMQASRYTAEATVMLDPRERKVIAAQDEVVGDLKLNNPILESEVAVLQSKTLLEDAVHRVGIDRFDVIDPARRPPSYLAGLFGGRGTGMADDGPIPADLRRSNRIVAMLRSGLNVRRVGDSYVIKVAVTTTDPVISADFANALTAVYIENQLADRRRAADLATRWLSDQVQGGRADLAKAETAVEAFKKTQLSETGATVTVLEQQVAELNKQLVLTQSDLAMEQARLAQIERRLADSGPIAAAETQMSDYILSLRQNRSAFVREDARLAESQGDQHPERLRIAADIRQIDEAIVHEVGIIAEAYRGEINILSTREATLSKAVLGIEARISDIAGSSLLLRELEREAAAARGNFEVLLARLGETRAQAEFQRAEARVVGEARVPGGPSAPRPKLMGAFGATLGLTIGLLAALALEFMTPGYASGADLERATNIPVLASLPAEPVAAPVDGLRRIISDPYSLMSERIRQVRTLLDVRAPDSGPHCLAILSSVPNEGKTTTCLALARSFAMSGRRTLLVDLDLRQSQLMADLAGEMDQGLEAYFDGTAGLAEVIAPVVETGFWVTGTRLRTGAMADRITAASLRQLVQDLGEEFDVVLFDAPPLLAVPDGLHIARAADSVLYLVQHRQTPRRSVAYGLAALRHAGLAPTGLVLSMVDVEADPDMYAAGYGYGPQAARGDEAPA